MFTFECHDISPMLDLVQQLPEKYLRTEDLTNQIIELLYYPNDYGLTSPITNLGSNISLKCFDYIGVPKAWDYFSENNIGNVVIGISDGKVLNYDLDLKNKVTYVNENFFNPTFTCGSEAWHGVISGALAAAQGNNSHGMTGICSDCDIVSTPYTLTYNGMLDLANAGVTVINTSWAYMYWNDTTFSTGFIPSQQAVINEIHDMGVVLVSSAGNTNSYIAAAPTYLVYGYPACYDNVISVTSVNHKNTNFQDELTPATVGMVSWYNEDLISPTGTYINGVYSSYYEGHTTNSKVDISAPGWNVPLYGSFLLNTCYDNGIEANYGNGTSSAAPIVTGTVALMQSLNPCLTPNEIEDIIQLTSKNIEINPSNSMFYGRVGAGKLETGDSVEFVAEAMSNIGNTIIEGQDFWRFNFDLQHIYNNLKILNQKFRDSNTSTFVAKSSIIVDSNSDFKPNSSGFIDLRVNPIMEICSNTNKKFNVAKRLQNNANFKNNIKLFPNPNNGNFKIKIPLINNDNVNIQIYDIFGKLIYSNIFKQSEFDISLNDLNTGVYIVKLVSSNFIENLKFIKN